MPDVLAALEALEALNIDCGDSSCLFAVKRTGMRTNGGCHCLTREHRPFERAALARLLKAVRAMAPRARADLDRGAPGIKP